MDSLLLDDSKSLTMSSGKHKPYKKDRTSRIICRSYMYCFAFFSRVSKQGRIFIFLAYLIQFEKGLCLLQTASMVNRPPDYHSISLVNYLCEQNYITCIILLYRKFIIQNTDILSGIFNCSMKGDQTMEITIKLMF